MRLRQQLSVSSLAFRVSHGPMPGLSLTIEAASCPLPLSAVRRRRRPSPAAAPSPTARREERRTRRVTLGNQTPAVMGPVEDRSLVPL